MTPAPSGVSDVPIDFGAGIRRRTYLKASGVLAVATGGLAGCVGRASGTLATSVTDQPVDIGDFESLVVTIEGIWLGPEGAVSGQEDPDDEGDEDDGTDGDGDDADEDEEESTVEPAGREYHEFDEPQQADLVELQGEETQLIDERELDVGEYEFLQLRVSDVEGTLVDGGEATVDTPGNAPLTFNEPFEIRENTRTAFTADFAPVRQGRTGRYLLRPVPEGIDVSYHDADTDDDTDGENADGTDE